MNKFIVIPDVTCDLSKELREYVQLKDYIRGYTHINGEPMRTQLDWELISRQEFYKILGNKKNTVSSATASPEEYYQMFKHYAEQGYDILSISISSAISATYNVSVTAAERIRADFPERKIHCCDSRRMSGSFGLLVMYACELCNGGKSFEETVEWLETNKYRVHQMGPIDDMTFIARRGKVSKGKAFMGNLAGIKPMGDSNAEGYVTVLGKAKGIKKALDATVGYVKRMVVDPQSQYILISHSDREEYAMNLKEKIEQTIPCKKVFVSDVFAGCGTNIGPGMISVYFMGDPVTEDSAREKEALTEALAEC